MNKQARRNHCVVLKRRGVWCLKQFSFSLLLLWSFTLAILFFTNKKQQRIPNLTGTITLSAQKRKTTLSNRITQFVAGRHLSLQTNSICFTVGFKSPTTKNGIGNHLFYFAGIMHGAWLTGRKPIILSSKENMLDKAFDLNITHTDISMVCPVRQINITNEDGIELLNNVESNVSIWMQSSFYSWKYTQPIEAELRRKLQFRQEVKKFAKTFLSANVPLGWNDNTFVRVGVHVRRGDYLKRWAVNAGFMVASEEYLRTAMTYFVERYNRVQFIVASNSMYWCLMHIDPSSFDKERINITFSIGHSTEQDLALLASCDHMVMTTGTFSWWAAWLANGTTIYYKNFRRHGSWLWQRSNASDYFPPWWIGI